MATSRRSRVKAARESERAGGELPESGSYTVETRTRRPKIEPHAPETPAESLAGMFAALGAGGQVGIYRTSPQWARGHLQTLTLSPGEAFDFGKLDELQRYWGGGTYQFRPMHRGRFQGSSRSIQLDGPTLYRGQPHPNDPDRPQARAVDAQVMPAGYPQPGYPGHGYPQHGYAPHSGYPEPPGMQQGSPELRMLGGLVERLMGRLDNMEAKLSQQTYAPASAPDHVSGVLQTLELAQRIRDMFDGGHDDDDDEPDEPPTPQQMMMMLAMKKLDENPDALFGNGQQQAPPQAAHAPRPGPRLIRSNDAEGDAAPPSASPMSAAQILAALQQLSPVERARLVNDVGQSLDEETLAAMAAMMQQQAPKDAAG